MTDGNLYALRQYEAQQDAEDQQQERLIERSNDLMLDMMHQHGDFLEALGRVVESGKLTEVLHEQYVEGRRKDFGVEICEMIDNELGQMAMELAKGEME